MPKMVIYQDSFKAGADLSTHQFKCVELSAADTVTLCNAATDVCIGILQNKPKSTEAAAVMHIGRSQALADGSGTAIAVGDFVGPNASGLLVKKATADFRTLGVALAAATAANIVIDVMLLGPGAFRTAAG